MVQPTTDRMQRLYHYLVRHRWGEPSDLTVFEGKRLSPPAVLDLLHVAIWDADAECNVTTFATLGMSEITIPGADYRTELTLGVRGPISADDRRDLARLLANLSEYPFVNQLRFDYWNRIKNPGRIPAFTGCSHLLLAPLFGDDEFRNFPAPDDDVRIISVLPITRRESGIVTDRGVDAFLDYWEESGTDIFSPRSDKHD